MNFVVGDDNWFNEVSIFFLELKMVDFDVM